MMKKLGIVAVSALVALTGASGGAHAAQKGAQQVRSVTTIDGDTVRATIGARPLKIRLVGIDAPEIETRLLNKSACPVEEKALGLRAKARTAELVDTSKHRVTVRFHRGRDVWNRNLADVYSDGKSVANTLVAEGLAKPWLDVSQPRPTFCDEVKK